MNYKLLIGLMLVLAIVPFVSAQENQGQTINGSFLWITEVNVEVCNPEDGCDDDDDLKEADKISEEARPGATVEFDIEVTNMYDVLHGNEDIEIDDIEVTVTIEDIDDGDEIDVDADFDDLDPGDDDSLKLEFDIPWEVDEDEFDVTIEVDGDSDNGSQEAFMTLTLEVEKENNKIHVVRYSLSPSSVSCSRSPTLDVTLLNIGSDDEDEVILEVTNNELDINIKEEFELESDAFDDDAEFRNSFRLAVSEAVKPGV